MKKVTFTKLLALSAKRNVIERPDYPGYLVELSNLPGVSIVIARGSRSESDAVWRFTDEWNAHDMSTGHTIKRTNTVGKTREECYCRVVAVLAQFTPERYARMIEDARINRITKLIKGESP